MNSEQHHKKEKAIGILMTYNCAHLIEKSWERIPKDVFDEIILVDDGSKDESEAKKIAEKLGIPFYSHEHRGYGGNLKYGLQKAIERGGEYMIELHGDAQFDPTAAVPALEKLRNGCDFLMGSRFTTSGQALDDGMSYARYFANRGLSFFDRIILGVRLTEFHGGFRGYSRRLCERFDYSLGSEDYLYSFEVIARARYYGLSICEVPVRANYTGEHTSISIKKATLYSFKTFWILFLYVVGRLGIETTLFKTEVR